MTVKWLAFAGMAMVASAAGAADKPVIAPPPPWVKPVAPPAPDTKPDEAPVRILLSDQQSRLERGRQTNYINVVARIQTPQGLSVGNISLPWRPETDTLTVHTLRIRRGEQVIDVLASGQTFTVVRREPNLESATLDGVLTANIQSEGLQVGDILEFAASTSSSDPVLKGHAEQIAVATWNGLPITRAHLHIEWPADLPVRLRKVGALPELKPVKSAGGQVLDLSLDRIEPVVPPAGAPPRFRIGRLVEASDFASWADMGALLAPLYRKAASLPAQGPLHAELERIRAQSADPVARAEGALALVQDRIRYVALAMGAGGLVPADAETTWGRRYGDCKAKTALLLGLLHALDIQADAVAVSSTFGDGMDARLPMIGLFDHVLVRATIAGRTYWLDGTRTGDAKLDRIEVPAFGWGLPLVASNAALVRMLPTPLAAPARTIRLTIDARAGLTIPAPAKAEAIFRGDAAIGTRLALANLAGEARDRALGDFWRGEFDSIEVKSAGASYDAATGEEHVTLDGVAKMDWSRGQYETDGTGVGYRADFTRQPGPNRDAPFAVFYPTYNRMVETILLPPGFPDTGAAPQGMIDRTIAGIHYRRTVNLTKNVFTIERTEQSIVPEFPAKDAPEAQAALRQLADDALYLRRPTTYRATDAEIAAAMAETPKTAGAYLARGSTLLERGRFDEALRDFDQAITLDPKSADALAFRAVVRVNKGNSEAAKRDIDAATILNPRSATVSRARGFLAERDQKWREALAAYTTSLEIEPGNGWALFRRSRAYHALNEDEAALADTDALLKLAPKASEVYLERANILRGLGRNDDVAKEVQALIAAANPNDALAFVTAANIYLAIHRDAEAMPLFDRALAIKPEPYTYLNRAVRRPKTDIAGRRADLDAALKLDPSYTEALAAQADLQASAGNLPGAIASYSAALSKTPEDLDLRVGRGIAYARAGDTAKADADFAAVRVKETDAVIANNICWRKATAGVALASALADCDLALAKMPGSPGFLDSRALVLLRLGRTDEAIRVYDEALAKAPRMQSSLYGRAIAWSRKGDQAKAKADADAAIKIDAAIVSQFADYDLKL